MPKSTHAVHVALLVSKWRSVQEDMHVYWNFDELLANSYPVYTRPIIWFQCTLGTDYIYCKQMRAGPARYDRVWHAGMAQHSSILQCKQNLPSEPKPIAAENCVPLNGCKFKHSI